MEGLNQLVPWEDLSFLIKFSQRERLSATTICCKNELYFEVIGTTILQWKVHGKEQNGLHSSVLQILKEIRNTWESFTTADFDVLLGLGPNNITGVGDATP